MIASQRLNNEVMFLNMVCNGRLILGQSNQKDKSKQTSSLLLRLLLTLLTQVANFCGIDSGSNEAPVLCPCSVPDCTVLFRVENSTSTALSPWSRSKGRALQPPQYRGFSCAGFELLDCSMALDQACPRLEIWVVFWESRKYLVIIPFRAVV